MEGGDGTEYEWDLEKFLKTMEAAAVAVTATLW